MAASRTQRFRLCIRDRTSNDSDCEFCEFEEFLPITVGKIRALLATEKECQTLCVQMSRVAGSSPRGDECYLTCQNNTRPFSADEYGVPDGKIFIYESVYQRRYLRLSFDDDLFPIVRGRYNVVDIVIKARPAQKVSFLVINDPFCNFSMEPLLWLPMEVRTLRGLISQVAKVNFLSLSLVRRILNERSDQPCYQVCDEVGEYLPDSYGIFATQDGAVYDDEYTEPSDRQLYVDSDTLPVVTNKKNVIFSFLEYGLTGYFPVHFRRTGGIDFVLCPLVRINYAASIIRDLVASRLDVDPKDILLEQWIGEASDHRPVIHVCTIDGHFVDITSDDAIFADWEGEVFRHHEIGNLRKRVIDDNVDGNLRVRNSRSIMYLSVEVAESSSPQSVSEPVPNGYGPDHDE